MTIEKNGEPLEHWMMENLVHFSNKLTNSNAPAGGIRLSKSKALDAQYVCARSHLNDLMAGKSTSVIDVDYIKPANIRMKEVLFCLGEEVDKEFSFSQEDMDPISTLYKNMCNGLHPALFTDLDIPLSRMKQVLLPHADRGYISVTPMNSAGMPKLFNELQESAFRLKAELKEKERQIEIQISEHKKTNDEKGVRDLEQTLEDIKARNESITILPRVRMMPYGGAKPQNVGSRVNKGLSRPFVFDDVPREDPHVKDFYRLMHNGLRLKIPKQLVLKYQEFWDMVRAKFANDKSWPLYIRSQEINIIQSMWMSWQRQSIKSITLIQQNISIEEFMEVSAAYRSNASLRYWISAMNNYGNPDLKKKEARALADSLARYELKTKSGEITKLPLSPIDLHRITSIIMKGFEK